MSTYFIEVIDNSKLSKILLKSFLLLSNNTDFFYSDEQINIIWVSQMFCNILVMWGEIPNTHWFATSQICLHGLEHGLRIHFWIYLTMPDCKGFCDLSEISLILWLLNKDQQHLHLVQNKCLFFFFFVFL